MNDFRFRDTPFPRIGIGYVNIFVKYKISHQIQNPDRRREPSCPEIEGTDLSRHGSSANCSYFWERLKQNVGRRA